MERIFLIDKDGTIYQTINLTRKCQHVGPIIARCLQMHVCTKREMDLYSGVKHLSYKEQGLLELKKPYPLRNPANFDSIGIEIVGRHIDDSTYETPTAEQQKALQWLVNGLLLSLNLQATDVYRHPQVSRKNPGEAKDANWSTSAASVPKHP